MSKQPIIINLLLRPFPLAVEMAPEFKKLWDRYLAALDSGVSDEELQTLIAEREALARLQQA